ncbi:PEPxxWA-CTERM sorting domain-containing protein [Janthinobacterium agaricidamnosum]|uniref:PEP-CTERM putative exosortase interaction domain protein n=1 Tax=Janthinobacterium agaricidamnosum NBRC 102515 = DSM 9628 TaxID=1349767 RepID=W0V773_9BURK|nr:PEPxxWA-CTERM sorting domain-containing protein [Janthinobacterium agaricidamnosum]CDG84684.1 PEP-CTERM putative exosortase interaction domain protein [Janthinobacterium agaricidamnosum NBRC 102515 = DSM 9628]
MRIKSILFVLAAVAALNSSLAQAAGTNLIKNGDFEQTTNGSAKQLGADGDTRSDRTQLVDWSTSGYNFVFAPNTADTTGSNGLTLWGPNSYDGRGPQNGLGNSPTGGNFVAADWDYFAAPISQSVSGLVSGQQYTLSFSYAAAQQSGFSGDNAINYWEVVLGQSAAQQTVSLSNTSQGFTGWKQASMTFTATDSTELLSFMAKGGPNGAPPFMLLDSVSLVSAVPEPSTWGMMLVGVGMLGFMVRRRRAAAL